MKRGLKVLFALISTGILVSYVIFLLKWDYTPPIEILEGSVYNIIPPKWSWYYSYFNPTAVKVGKGWVFALRETNSGLCPRLFGVLHTLAQVFNPPHNSNVLMTYYRHDIRNSAGDVYVTPAYRVPMSPFVEGKAHSVEGHMDPRFFVHRGRVFMVSVLDRHGQFKLFLTTFKNDLSRVTDIVEIIPRYSFEFHQKNWVHVPSDEELPLFIAEYFPLRILKLNLTDGEATNFYVQRHNNTLWKHMRGSTNFVPFEDGVFLSIAHTRHLRQMLPGFELDACYYYNYFVLMNVKNGIYTLTKLSRPFMISHNRITFPMTLIREQDEFIITYGKSDCTSHAMIVTRDQVLGMFE